MSGTHRISKPFIAPHHANTFCMNQALLQLSRMHKIAPCCEVVFLSLYLISTLPEHAVASFMSKIRCLTQRFVSRYPRNFGAPSNPSDGGVVQHQGCSCSLLLLVTLGVVLRSLSWLALTVHPLGSCTLRQHCRTYACKYAR